MILLIVALCVSFTDVQENYYSEQSYRIAAVQPNDLCFSGDSLYIALNRIARANYKHQNYRRAYRITGNIHTRREKIKYDTMSLRALLAKNIGKFGEADSLYGILFSDNIPYRDILFEAHLNYAELLRLQLDYDGRQTHLMQAMYYAEGWQRNKVIRVLARHHFGVLRDFKQAEQVLSEHTTPSTNEGRAGWLLVQAQFAEAQERYRQAMRYYRQAQTVARQAGFVTFMFDASDGYMRSNVSLSQSRDRRLQWIIVNGILVAVFFGVWWYNRKL